MDKNNDVVIKRTPIVEDESTKAKDIVVKELDPYAGMSRQRIALAKYLENITAKSRPSPLPTDPTDVQAKVTALQDAISSGDINQTTRDRWCELFSIVLGAPVDWKKGKSNRVSYPRGTVVVPLRNDNSHDYELNKPCMSVDASYPDCVAMKASGDTGNTFRYDNANNDPKTPRARVATQDEVIAFAKECDVPRACEQLRILLVE